MTVGWTISARLDELVGGKKKKSPFPEEKAHTIEKACAVADPPPHLSLHYIPLHISSPCSLMHKQHVAVTGWKLCWEKSPTLLCLPVASTDDSNRRIDKGKRIMQTRLR